MTGNILIVITGSTASGKTSLAIEAALKLGTSIISADSRQCYRGMSIGTAQPSPEELAAVRHYFINEFAPCDELSAARFERLALGYLENIFRRNRIAIVCGGTGLYIRALCEGLDEMPAVDAAIAAGVEEGYKAGGREWLQEALLREDSRFAQSPEWQNPARLMRALSFVRCTGRSILDYRSGAKKERPFRIVKVAPDVPRDVLYARINRRVDAMMEAGLLEEVRALLPYRNCKALQTVGYAELFEYLDGHCTLPEAVDRIKQHTRNYAKRQLTWLRKEEGVHWLPYDDTRLAERVIQLGV